MLLRLGTRSGTFPKTSRWAIPPGCLWQLSPHCSWTDLSFYQTWVPGGWTDAVLNWLEAQKKTNLRTLLGGECLGPEAVQYVLDGVTLGAALRAKACDPAMVESDHNIEKEVCVGTSQVLVKMHVANCAAAWRDYPVLGAVLNWLEAQKKTNLRTLLGENASSEEGQMVWRNHQSFTTL